MNKLPAKQIYLLSIIIVGIIALSVYSTYALFTFESSTSDIVSIHTPHSLNISENVYEYQQITVEPNTVTTTDIDIHNAFEYEVCYSIWYKVIGTDEIKNKIQVFEKSEEVLTTSGVLSPNTNIRVTVVIINDNDSKVKINLGTIGAQKQDESCTLNLSNDKNVISSSYKNLDILTDKILEEKDKTTEIEENYLTYQDLTETITFNSEDKIYASEEFTYKEEIFTLNNQEELTVQEMVEENNLQINNIYFCQESSKCSIIYKIQEIEKEEIEQENKEEKIINYKITKYDKLIGYSKGTNGLRKINEQDYVYYGDNPNNYVYYNCLNNDNLNTCELWRIVGFFYNKETKKYNPKIVRNESIGKYQFDYKMENNENNSTNNWEESTLNKYLNEEYKFKTTYDIYIDEYKQQIERIPNLETNVKNMKIDNKNITSKTNVLNLSDYLHASSCQKNKINEYTGECLTNNWLNNIEIEAEWTMTSKEVEEIIEQIKPPEENAEVIDETENSGNNTGSEELITETEQVTESVDKNKYVINYVYSIGENIKEYDVNESLEVRPVIFLKSRMVLLEGNGSFEKPYIIK